jgi:MFS family permease
MTAVCGMATSFGALLLARVGVGVGEAGGAPPSYSLISDYFPRERRSTVFALLNTSVPMGVFCGLLIGGYVNANFGWRATLIAIGLFGVGIAVIVRFTVREPARGSADRRPVAAAPGIAVPSVSVPSLAETLRYLWARRSYRHLVCGTSIATLGGFGSGVWMLSFFVRVHHLPPPQVATWLAFIYGGCGLIGVTMGGVIADRLSRRRSDWRWQGWLSAMALGSILPFALVVFLAPVATTAFAALVGVVLLMHMWMGPAYGTVQSLAPPASRAMAAAINLLVVNLLAMGCGPLLVGAMSDFFNARFGEDAIRYAILSLVAVTYTWAAIHFFLASRTLREELQS